MLSLTTIVALSSSLLTVAGEGSVPRTAFITPCVN